ncbi:hypothetical protein B0H13DRAFT_2435228 [Mycena leptocephala]|nr:hypothetical protein B0H13DRAFT_2435228 [Mycena leptocephala]
MPKSRVRSKNNALVRNFRQGNYYKFNQRRILQSSKKLRKNGRGQARRRCDKRSAGPTNASAGAKAVGRGRSEERERGVRSVTSTSTEAEAATSATVEATGVGVTSASSEGKLMGTREEAGQRQRARARAGRQWGEHEGGGKADGPTISPGTAPSGLLSSKAGAEGGDGCAEGRGGPRAEGVRRVGCAGDGAWSAHAGWSKDGGVVNMDTRERGVGTASSTLTEHGGGVVNVNVGGKGAVVDVGPRREGGRGSTHTGWSKDGGVVNVDAREQGVGTASSTLMQAQGQCRQRKRRRGGVVDASAGVGAASALST